MEGEEYLGSSALHLAIAYSNNELVSDLIDAGANIHQRAIGRFFLPKDQQSNTPAKTTDYEGLAYLGEYPLAWAACVNNEAVYNLLLEVGADPDAQDSFGNMILHMVVVCDKLDMFGYALRLVEELYVSRLSKLFYYSYDFFIHILLRSRYDIIIILKHIQQRWTDEQKKFNIHTSCLYIIRQ